MAIKIRGKYTNTKAAFREKKGLYDFSATTIVINADGSIKKDTEINLFLGYQGEDRVRVVNIDTRALNWGDQKGSNAKKEKELSYYYSPRVLFFNPKEPRKDFVKNEDGVILVINGKFIVQEVGTDVQSEGLPNPFMIPADENYFYIPNEVTNLITTAPYEIVYALIEKQDETEDIASGNISDHKCTIEDCSCFNNEIFVSEVFHGHTKKSGKDLFDKHKSQPDWEYYSYTCNGGTTPGLSDKPYLHKTPLECKVDKGILQTADNQELMLGHQGDVYITPLKIYIPVPAGVWSSKDGGENKAEVTKIEVVFVNGDDTYLVQPNIEEVNFNEQNNLSIVCWIPKEITDQATKEDRWQIALHLWTEAEPLFEIYTTIIEGRVEYTFIEEQELVTEQDKLEPLYQVEGTTLVIAGEDWLDVDDDIDMWIENEEENGVVNLGRHQI